MNEHNVGLHLKKIINLLARGRNQDLKLYGLTGTQMEVLEYLHDRPAGDCTVTGIAAFFDVKHTSVLHVVTLLEKKQLIRREEKKQGSRLRRIVLTQAGEGLMRETDRCKSEADEIMLQGMTEEEKQILTQLLERIYRNLKQGEARLKRRKENL